MKKEQTTELQKNQNKNKPNPKKENFISLGWAIGMIVLYCVSASWAKGRFSSVSPVMTGVLFADAVIITALLFWKKWIQSSGLSLASLKKSEFYRPCFLALFLIALPNLVFALTIPENVRSVYGNQLIFGILSMVLVGYLEEVIFRGMLFDAIAASSLKEAVIITSLTFGIGHLSNLFTGQNLFETLIQIAYAVCIGFAFVTARIASGSIWMCIAVHALVDVLSLFISSSMLSSAMILAGGGFLIVLSLLAAGLIIKANPDHRYF